MVRTAYPTESTSCRVFLERGAPGSGKSPERPGEHVGILPVALVGPEAGAPVGLERQVVVSADMAGKSAVGIGMGDRVR